MNPTKHGSPEAKAGTGPVMITGFLVLFLVFKKPVFLYVSLTLGLIFSFAPALGNRIADLWFKAAELLGKFNSKILLALVFFLFLMPVSFIFRLFNKNPLALKNPGSSLYTERNHKYTAGDLENIW